MCASFRVFSLNFEGDKINCPLGRFLKGQFQLQCGIGAMARPGSSPGKIGSTHDLQKPEIRPNFSSSHILSNGYTAKIGPNTNSREQVCAHCGQILAATLIGY